MGYKGIEVHEVQNNVNNEDHLEVSIFDIDSVQPEGPVMDHTDLLLHKVNQLVDALNAGNVTCGAKNASGQLVAKWVESRKHLCKSFGIWLCHLETCASHTAT